MCMRMMTDTLNLDLSISILTHVIALFLFHSSVEINRMNGIFIKDLKPSSILINFFTYFDYRIPQLNFLDHKIHILNLLIIFICSSVD